MTNTDKRFRANGRASLSMRKVYAGAPPADPPVADCSIALLVSLQSGKDLEILHVPLDTSACVKYHWLRNTAVKRIKGPVLNLEFYRLFSPSVSFSEVCYL